MEENAGIVRLTAEHNILPFDCGDSDLNDFLVSDAKAYQEKLLAGGSEGQVPDPPQSY